MKLRNRLLALFCLLIFIAFGVFFFRTWVVQKPFGMILFLNDGLSTNLVTAARLYEGGATHRLTVESFPHLALVRNASGDYAVPDAEAAASAIATGVKVNNRALSVDARGEALRSLLTLARDAGRATGLVTTGSLTDPTPAAFYANGTDANDAHRLAEAFVKDAPVDLALGGGLAAFTPESKGGARKDGRDLWLELRSKGYSLVRTKAELENTPAFLTGPMAGIFSDGYLPYASELESGGQQPSLSDMVRRAIEILQTNARGYLLVVDCAAVSRLAGENRGDQVLAEMVQFDRALEVARRYAGEKTLIVAVGKHEVGGLTLNGFPLKEDRGVALLGTNASGFPSLTWSTGPNGRSDGPPKATLGIAADGSEPAPLHPPGRDVSAEPAAFRADYAIPTARDMLMVGSGPGSETIGGFMENTAVFELFKQQL
ncbi:MAG TPA: alkaline phosphatase [Chthoniobacteraceae bacterium]|nr:alkaline phosphatase [Chthoniobacteraceae bacterium]